MIPSTATLRRYTAAAGALLVFAEAVALMGIIISAEALYPGYSTSANMISDLGASEPPNSIIRQPSATLFNLTMLATGLFVLGAPFALHRAGYVWVVPVPLAAFGLGTFPGNWGDIHALAALLTFVAGAVSVIAVGAVIRSPLRYITAVLGAISLLTLVSFYVLGDASPMLAFGPGGLERWIVYPVMLFVLAFGGYLMGDAQRTAAV